MGPEELLFVLRCKEFASPYKAAVSKTAHFLAAAERYGLELLKTSLTFQPQLAECLIGTKNDAPSSSELERLTRNFFTVNMLAFAVEEGACLVAEVQFDPDAGTFGLQKRRYPFAVQRLQLPTAEWVDWFLQGERCPSCRLFPDQTTEYTSCQLCGYADYAEDVEVARDRSSSSPETPQLVTAVRRLLDGARSEVVPIRATYLRYRVYVMWTVPSSALDPLPW